MIQEAHKKQTLPDSLSLSYITLIPKDNPDKTQMKNYRPISLLNVDYKIISKTITNKLQPYMSKLIHADQQCSIIGRKIQNHLHFIRDIITYTQEKQMHAAIISLDQEKAFDRVAHDYLFKTITAHNLGTYIETWIKTLYKNPQSQLYSQLYSYRTILTYQIHQTRVQPLSPSLHTNTRTFTRKHQTEHHRRQHSRERQGKT